ncbi:hypothetical protein XENOCAPTIV_015081 [Xenoophorus captivus]|uniref:Uncharacterized protein n=1 Tax=Xenoophorus captivus TaxID=1517983 RepID=A0ABV0S841_9TELE
MAYTIIVKTVDLTVVQQTVSSKQSFTSPTRRLGSKRSLLKKLALYSQSFIFYTASSIVGRGEAGAYLQQSMGGRQGTPWIGRQSIAGQHANALYSALHLIISIKS